MAEAGVDLVFSIDELSAVGITEVVARLPHFRRLLRSIENEVDARRPAAALLIDSPDFNLRLAGKLKASGVPVVYYISPTVWAWRRGRLETIRRCVDRMLLIFPFEREIYEEQGIPFRFVGHPLLDSVAVKLSREEFLAKHGLRGDRPIVCLLPGSRPSELRRHLLDSLREGDVAHCEEALAAMGDIYDVLVTMDFPEAITGGLRRTTDAMRGILERTRGDFTMAAVQRRLEERLDRFQRDLPT